MTPNPKRILIVDDNKAIHEDFYKILKPSQKIDEELSDIESAIYGNQKQPIEESNYIIDSAYQGQEALGLVKAAVAENNNYSLAFIDIRMPPGWDGVVTIQHLWEVDPAIQIVICTAYSDYSWKDIQKLHYSDNLLILKKPFDVIEIRQLVRALTRKWDLDKEVQSQMYHLQDIVRLRTIELEKTLSLRKKLEEQLFHQATHDSLTGLPNRILLTDRLEQAIIHAKRIKEYIGVLIFDLDNFKEINDSLGHSTGDVLLKLVALRLKDTLNETDTVVRMGGDEFVVLLPHVQREEEITLKAKELLHLFLSPCQLDHHTLTVTSSIGISIYPKDGQNSDMLLKNADTALYQAKELGKNGYQFYMPEFNARTLQRAELITSLREAVEKNQLVLHYQPLVKMETGTIIGMEALVRWKHPKRGLIYPKNFINLAEETGLIVSIGEWVLNEACQQTKKWQDMLGNVLTIAVNVSGYQFQKPGFINMLKKVLQLSSLDPHYLELEMTESLIFKNIPETSEKMSELKKLGVKLSIDDFGTGYASFSYLKDFPFDKVKIDKSFIDGIHLNNHDNAIVEAIITMTTKMGIEVLAEGVETKAQADFLEKHHGNQVQGYYYSKPLNAEASTKLLLKHKSSKVELT